MMGEGATLRDRIIATATELLKIAEELPARDVAHAEATADRCEHPAESRMDTSTMGNPSYICRACNTFVSTRTASAVEV